MYSFDIYLDGKDEPGERWTYVVRASAFIADLRRAFSLKRSLELGRIDHAGEQVAGRCAVSSAEQNARALVTARRASQQLRAMPLADRCAMVMEFNRALEERQDEVTRGTDHPQRPAQRRKEPDDAGGRRATRRLICAA